MKKQNDPLEAIREFWPGVDQFMALPDDQREAETLKGLNQSRAYIGGPPLDHLPSKAELQAWRAEADAAYQKQYHSWSARWNRFLDRLLGPA